MLRFARFLLLWVLAIAAFAWLQAETSLDSERLDLETRMQSRVEGALARILPPGQFVVVVRVEPLKKISNDAEPSSKDDPEFYLPGVPVRRGFDNSGDKIQSLVDTLKTDNKSFQRFISRVQVTLVLDKDLSDESVSKVRDLTRQMLSLDAERGDTLDVQRTVFNKPPVEVTETPTGILKFQREVRSYWLLIALVLALIVVGVFVLFVFGPLRGFLNNFVQILPTLKSEGGGGRISLEMPNMLPSSVNNYGLPNGGGGGPASFSGSLQVDNPNKNVLPFGFIREDHLANLAILLARESPEKAAVVLGYLPPDWISKVLARLEPSMQTDVAANLATTRQLLPEQVEDIEQDLKRRLDYLIGGPERIFAVYESLDPDAQKRMMDSLKESRPEIVEQLRQRTILFDDLDRFDPAALKSILREVDLQTIVMALRGTTDGFKDRILEHMSAGKAEIVKQELDLSEGSSPGKTTAEAQRKVVAIAKRMEKEGQIHVPTIETEGPTSRFGPSLRSTLKLPPGLRRGDVLPAETPNDDIKDRIRRFMDRHDDPDSTQERYPQEPRQ